VGPGLPGHGDERTRIGRPDVAVDALLMGTGTSHYLRTGHCPQMGSLLPLYLSTSGGLLAAVSLMAAEVKRRRHRLPRVPRDGSWTVRHEGFTTWPSSKPPETEAPSASVQQTRYCLLSTAPDWEPPRSCSQSNWGPLKQAECTADLRHH